ncbi:unnamed protein product, partial [Cladocopium goreaui]
MPPAKDAEQMAEKIAEKILADLPGEASSHWQKHMPRHGLMWRETDFWGDLALDLPKKQLQRPETCRCIHDCNFCREQRQTLKEEKPRLPTPGSRVQSPYVAPFLRPGRRSRRSQRDIWKHRERGYKAGDISLQRRCIELHMPAHVVLHDDLRRSDQAMLDAEELLSGQRRKKEAVRVASRRAGTAPGRARQSAAPRSPRSRRSSVGAASPESPAEDEADDKTTEDVQAILRYRERRQSVLCERPPAAPEERDRKPRVDWKPRVTVTFQRKEPVLSQEDGPVDEKTMENDLGTRARRLVYRQKQKSAMDRSAIRADRRAHKEAASSLRELARLQLLKEGDRIVELIRAKDEAMIQEDFHRYDEDGNGQLQLTEIRGVLEDAGLLPKNDEEKASVRRTIVNMALKVEDGETDEEKELAEAKGNELLVQQGQEQLARSVELQQEQMPELLQRIRKRLRVAQRKVYFACFTKFDMLDEGELAITEVLQVLQELKLLPDLDEARSDFARWVLSTVKGRESKVQSVASEDLDKKKRQAAKAKAKLRTSKTGTERPGSRSERSERPGSRERPSSREHEEPETLESS